jgi:hypothetical protein
MTVNKMTVNKTTVNKTTVNKMTVNKTTVNKMTVNKMTVNDSMYHPHWAVTRMRANEMNKSSLGTKRFRATTERRRKKFQKVLFCLFFIFLHIPWQLDEKPRRGRTFGFQPRLKISRMCRFNSCLSTLTLKKQRRTLFLGCCKNAKSNLISFRSHLFQVSRVPRLPLDGQRLLRDLAGVDLMKQFRPEKGQLQVCKCQLSWLWSSS